MAQGSRIYKLKLELSDLDRGIYDSLSLNLNLHPSESAERLVARLLAFVLNYQPELEFGRGLSTQEDATLWLRDHQGQPSLWIEVGQVEAERLAKISRRADHTRLYCFAANTHRWWQQHAEAFEGLGKVDIYGLPVAVVAELAAVLQPRIELQVVIQEGECQLFLADHHWQFAPQPWLIAGQRIDV